MVARAKKEFQELCDNAERAAQQVGEGSGAARSPEGMRARMESLILQAKSVLEIAGSPMELEGDDDNADDADYEGDEDYEDEESEDDGEIEECNENAARPNAGPSTESEAEASTRPQGGAADSGQDVNLFPPLDISDSDKEKQRPAPWRPGRLENTQETGTSESEIEEALKYGPEL